MPKKDTDRGRYSSTWASFSSGEPQGMEPTMAAGLTAGFIRRIFGVESVPFS
ncbi:MAG: hypothetical protein ACLTXL_12525 [Clostridia bacterium]